MKHLSCLLGLLFLWSAPPAVAQVTIDRADIAAQVGVEMRSFQWDANDNAAGSPMPDTTGLHTILQGGAADFTAMVADLNQVARFVLMEMPADVPGADSFATATHVQAATLLDGTAQEDSTAYSFLDLQANAMTFLGFATDVADLDGDSEPDTLVARYQPGGWAVRTLPLESGDAWTTEHTQVTWVVLPVVGLYRSEGLTERREYEVLGTTTLETPAGSGAAIVLHVVEFFDQPQAQLQFAREQYSFITESGLAVEVAFEIDYDTRQRLRLNDVAYVVPEGGDSGTAIAPVDSELPTTLTLGPNYPNPFNPTTTLSFGVAQAGPVRLAVYDVLGREVAVLVDAAMPAGTYEATFAAGRLPSGLYLYRLEAGGHTLTRTMLLQK